MAPRHLPQKVSLLIRLPDKHMPMVLVADGQRRFFEWEREGKLKILYWF